jgi:hypothetical protein
MRKVKTRNTKKMLLNMHLITVSTVSLENILNKQDISNNCPISIPSSTPFLFCWQQIEHGTFSSPIKDLHKLLQMQVCKI